MNKDVSWWNVSQAFLFLLKHVLLLFNVKMMEECILPQIQAM